MKNSNNTFISLMIFWLIFFSKLIHSQSYYGVTHFFDNNFPGGLIIIDNNTYNVPIMTARDSANLNYWGITVLLYSNDNTTHTSTAIDNQVTLNSTYKFYQWNLSGQYQTTNISSDFNVSSGYTGNWYIQHQAMFNRYDAINLDY